MNKQKYYILEWPESQEWMEQYGCIEIIKVDMEGSMIAVPCELIDNKNISTK